MSTAMAIIGAVAATVAVIKLLTSRRGSFIMPGFKLTWGRWFINHSLLGNLIYWRYKNRRNPLSILIIDGGFFTY